MKNKEIKHKSLYLQVLRENHIWKNDFKTLYSLYPNLELYKVNEMYERFVEENENKVDNFINFTLETAVNKEEKELLEEYFGLFKDNKKIESIAKEQNRTSYSLSRVKNNAMRKIRHRLRVREDFKEQKNTIDKLMKKYETELTSTV